MRKAEKQKPFIYYEDLKSWEKVCILIYGIITFFVIVIYIGGSPKLKQDTIFFYSVTLQLVIYFFLYTSLKNFKSYLIWFGFGIAQIILFFIFKGNPDLQMKHANASYALANTVPFLLLFQLLRYISLKLQNREFVAPSKGGGTDLFENRNPSPEDYFILFIYLGSFVGINILTINFKF